MYTNNHPWDLCSNIDNKPMEAYWYTPTSLRVYVKHPTPGCADMRFTLNLDLATGRLSWRSADGYASSYYDPKSQ
jgi:hypothetical protein